MSEMFKHVKTGLIIADWEFDNLSQDERDEYETFDCVKEHLTECVKVRQSYTLYPTVFGLLKVCDRCGAEIMGVGQ